jgi:hypothetical protein
MEAQAGIDLNQGLGKAPIGFYTDFSLATAGATTGGAILFFRSVLEAVHHVNRRCRPDDYLALAFPEFSLEEPRLKRFGNRVRVFGSEARLEELLDTERVARCFRTGLLSRIPRIRDSDAFERGAAFIRIRAGDKLTEGEIARRLHRFNRRGKESLVLEQEFLRLRRDDAVGERARRSLESARRGVEAECGRLLLSSGVSLIIGRRDGGDRPTDMAEVTTYGLSLASSPSLLPGD